MSITESTSAYDNLEHMSTRKLLKSINSEDHKTASAVKKAIPQIEALINEIEVRMRAGGRLFYIGAGTSGRLGILDASECPPTYGVSSNVVIGIIAGGDKAIRKAVELAEDNLDLAWNDLKGHNIDKNDTVIGLAASGQTPYVIGGVKSARERGILTGGITCNKNSLLKSNVDFIIEAIVGPEFVTGSTRMKAGTAQKLILNMISTSLMIKLGKVKGNKMVDMQPSNSKLVQRGIRMIMEELSTSEGEAKSLLNKYGSVRAAISNVNMDK